MALYINNTDEELVALLRDGSEAAFTELYDRYWKRLLIRAKLLLGSYEDAEEIVHDIFVKLWQKRGSLAITHSIHTYLAAMLQYRCFESLATRKRRAMMTFTPDVPDMADLSTQEWLDFEALREQLESAVSQLPEKCQLIFRLSREQGLTDQAIADELDLSVGTVRTQMHRALTKLKTSLHSFFLL